MAKPIKLTFLWHFHQPYYEFQGEMVLPWARLHAVKDYLDIPKIFTGYPKVKHTINLTPTLYDQLAMYADGLATDKAMRLSRKNAEELEGYDKDYILDNFFTINEHNLLRPHHYYSILFDKKNRGEDFSLNDFRDLQVWYNLAWLGNVSREEPYIQYLFRKGIGFTEVEKNNLLDYHLKIISDLPKEMKRLRSFGNIRYSFTPYHHPILPLLDSKGKDYTQVNYPLESSADKQLDDGIDFYKDFTSEEPIGSWPSEGSISANILAKYAYKGIKWVATDESVLHASDTNTDDDIVKFFPQRISTENGSISIFFRDIFLSDNIGFKYMNWKAEDAAKDFVGHIGSIRNAVIERLGEEALDSACVNIILDGENCWEFYHNNGFDFLHSLLKEISECDFIDSSFHDEIYHNSRRDIIALKPGSWINASFSIWDGDKEDLKAWDYLSTAATEVNKNKSHKNHSKASKLIDICEGSDWFWWFGPEHRAPDRLKFDSLFRDNLKLAYQLLDLDIPEYLEQPIMEEMFKGISISDYDEIKQYLGIEFSVLYSGGESAMHSAGNKPIIIAASATDLYIEFTGLIEDKTDILINNLQVDLSTVNIEGNVISINNIYSTQKLESITINSLNYPLSAK
jgi:alpha-amylase/alpha-mannosidase (GH57 family)